jgi:hypothetical protein
MSSFSPGSPSGQPSQGAGRTAAAVFVAVAVLAVTGAVFGYLIGARANPTDGTNTPQAHPPTTGTARQPTRTRTTAGTPSGKPCPAFVQTAAEGQGARGTLRLELYILTKQSEVWICKDDGRLWYQGHRIDKARYPDETPVEGTNGLFLTTVIGLDNGRFLATNTSSDGVVTKYTVSTQTLRIVRTDPAGKVLGDDTQPVTSHEP